MRLTIEIIAAATQVVCIGAGSAAFAGGKMRGDRRKICRRIWRQDAVGDVGGLIGLNRS